MYSLSVGVAKVKLGRGPEKDANVTITHGNSALALIFKFLLEK